MNILLIEDNETITKGLEYFFKENGYHVLVAHQLKEAKAYLKEADFIVLDVILPDGNGFDFYEQEIKETKTLFLTAKDEEEHIIKGLQMGAEDYMTKPFSPKELLARIERILQRNSKPNKIKIQNITFDMDKMIVYHNKNVVELTALELKILYLLFQNVGKVVSRNMLLDSIWNWTGNDVDAHTVTVYMKRIREKLKTNIITTVKGMGYRIDG